MDEKFKKILEAAVAAPSGDNCQPWEFEIADGSIRLFNLPGRDTSLYNFEQRASMAAHGALLENLSIAARHLGYECKMSLFPEPANPELVATVELTPAKPEHQPLFDAIFQRTTNRRVFDGGELSAVQKADLKNAGEGIAGVRVHLADSREEITRLAQALSANDRLVFENENLHKFLFDHLRWSEEEARLTRDGLDIRTFELSKLDAFGFSLMKYWSFVSLLNKLGIAKKVQRQAEKLCLSASAILAVTVSGDSLDDYLQGGRGMERVWLEATRQGLSCHSVSGLAYLVLRLKAGSVGGLSPAHQEMIRDVFQQLDAIFPMKGEVPVMLFRLGKSDPPSARSLRISPEEQIKNR